MMIETTVRRKALFHKPTGKWIALDYADAVYGGHVDGIEQATLFPENKTVSEVAEGVNFEFHNVDPDDFEMRDVEVTYRLKG